MTTDPTTEAAAALVALMLEHLPDEDALERYEERACQQHEFTLGLHHLTQGLIEELDPAVREEALDAVRRLAAPLGVEGDIASACEALLAPSSAGATKRCEPALERLWQATSEVHRARLLTWLKGPRVDTKLQMDEAFSRFLEHGSSTFLPIRWEEKFERDGTVFELVLSGGDGDFGAGLAGAFGAIAGYEPGDDWALIAEVIRVEHRRWHRLNAIELLLEHEHSTWSRYVERAGPQRWDEVGPCAYISDENDERRDFGDEGGDKWVTTWSARLTSQGWLVARTRDEL